MNNTTFTNTDNPTELLLGEAGDHHDHVVRIIAQALDRVHDLVYCVKKNIELSAYIQERREEQMMWQRDCKYK